jgi:hypothetical protein
VAEIKAHWQVKVSAGEKATDRRFGFCGGEILGGKSNWLACQTELHNYPQK